MKARLSAAAKEEASQLRKEMNHMRSDWRRAVMGAAALLAVIFFAIAKSGSHQPTLHLVLHSHLDPGWKLTYDETYLTLAVPIFKQVVLELLIDPDRTFVMEPVAYVSRFLADSGGSPLSTQVGGESVPIGKGGVRGVGGCEERSDEALRRRRH